MDGCMHAQLDACMDGWMHTWIDAQAFVLASRHGKHDDGL